MLKSIFLLFGLILICLNRYIGGITEHGQLIIFLVGIIVIGIPHGGADKMIAIQNSIHKKRKFSELNFHLLYLGKIILFSVFLLNFPIAGLLIFLILAGYHFGETDMYDWDIHNITGRILIACYGTFILGVIFLPNFHLIKPGLSLLQQDSNFLKVLDWIERNNAEILFCQLLLLLSSMVVFFIFHKSTLQKHWFKLVELIILVFILYKLPVILGFSFYFVIWHAVFSIKNTVSYLYRNKAIEVLVIVKEILKNSMIAILCVATFGIFVFVSLNSQTIIIYTILGLATLTAPHMEVMHHMYGELKSNKVIDK